MPDATRWLPTEKAAELVGLTPAEFLERVALDVFPQGVRPNMRDWQWNEADLLALAQLRWWLDPRYVEAKKSSRAQRRRKRASNAPE